MNHTPRSALVALLHHDPSKADALRYLTLLVKVVLALQLGEAMPALDLTVLTSQVAATEGVEASAVALIGTLAAELTAQASDPTAVADLAARLKASADALAAAIAANTAAPAPVAAPAPAADATAPAPVDTPPAA